MKKLILLLSMVMIFISSNSFTQNFKIDKINPANNLLTFEMHDITDMKTSHDLQSVGSPQQLWYDFQTGSLNAVFTTSQLDAPWSDRTCTYFFSSDQGGNWVNVCNIPDTFFVTSGYPSVIGLSSGNIVVANHTNLNGGQARAQLFINSNPGDSNFINYDPGSILEGNPLYPKLGKSNDDLILFSAYSNSNTFKNDFDIVNGTFGGYSSSPGGTRGGYSYATSDLGKLGFAYLDGAGSAFFYETTDNGLTWTSPLKIFEPFEEIVNGETLMHGTLSGIDLTYIDEAPKVVFEVVRYDQTMTSIYFIYPSEIYFWSPENNFGQPFAIADTTTIPFYPNRGNSSIFFDNCASLVKPVIGKASGTNVLFVAFYASTDDLSIWFNVDSTRVYAGYFIMSEDAGETWTNPEKFTPISNPPLDWRWVSIASTNPVSGNKATVHLAMVGDPVAGVNGFFPPPTLILTAKFYHFSAEIILTNVNSEVTESNVSFNLYPNYPNPFNPTTKIKFTIPQADNPLQGGARGGLVTLKVYDILGNEIATLVNEEKPAGEYEIEFSVGTSRDLSISSGIYFYQLRAGDFLHTKKMILLK